jgi:hypothetical protein
MWVPNPRYVDFGIQNYLIRKGQIMFVRFFCMFFFYPAIVYANLGSFSIKYLYPRPFVKNSLEMQVPTFIGIFFPVTTCKANDKASNQTENR